MVLLKVLGFLVTVVVIQTSLALPPSLQVLRRQLALMSCSDVANEQRRDCGFTKISAEECINRGCCWQPWLSPGPWCYQPSLVKGKYLDMCVDTPCDQRMECGHSVSSWKQCVLSDCCWAPAADAGAPWCFKKPGYSKTTTSTLLTTAMPTEPEATAPEEVYKDCQALYDHGFTLSGVYTISPDSKTQFDVYCEQDLDGGGWTVFQHRRDGSVDFYRDWDAYKTGFGYLNGEFWLGNDNIHLLTNGKDQKLKVELKYEDTDYAYADYSNFWVNDELKKYQLHVTGFSQKSPPGDSLNYHNGQYFSTKDRDNDSDCSVTRKGAWWYLNCDFSNLNGIYDNTGPVWGTWKGASSLKISRMMVKANN